MVKCLAVGIGGFFGSLLRYLVGLIPIGNGGSFPLKTLLINITGAFVLGTLTAYTAKNPGFPENAALMLKVGICGGFTTFSTFALETSALFGKGKPVMAAAYVAFSLILGIAAAIAGQQLVH